jgi:hypothetical protein
MKRSLSACILATAGAIAFAAPAGAASDYQFSLGLSGPSTGTVGKPMTFAVVGKNPPVAEYWFPLWLSVATIDSAVAPTCPASHQDAIQLAASTGGEWLAFARREQVQPDGAFSATLGYTPPRAARWLICGYTDDGITNTLARASWSVNVTGAPASPGGPAGPGPGPGAPPVGGTKPANTKAPRVTRSGSRLVCNPGRWTGATGGYAYRWLVNGKAKRGATGRKLAATRSLRGRKLACSVTASNAAGATTAVSRPRRVP